MKVVRKPARINIRTTHETLQVYGRGRRKLGCPTVTRHDNHVKSGELDFTIKSGNLEREPVGI